MPISARVSGSWKECTPSVRVSGAWKTITTGSVRVGGAWKEFYTSYVPPGLSASLSPGSLSGSGYGTGPFTTTGSVTTTASGGSPGYSYLWELVSGDSSITPDNSTSQTTTFSASGTPTQTKNATYRCKVTDAAASVAYTGNVTIALTFNPALSVTEDTTNASGTDAQSGPPYFFNAITTNTVTATPAGGAGGYTYLWEYVSGDTGFACNASTAATTDWTYSSVPATPEVKSAIWRCKVTDSASNVVYTASIYLTANFDSL